MLLRPVAVRVGIPAVPSLREVLKEIEDVPVCPRSGEMNFYYYVINPYKKNTN